VFVFRGDRTRRVGAKIGRKGRFGSRRGGKKGKEAAVRSLFRRRERIMVLGVPFGGGRE